MTTLEKHIQWLDEEIDRNKKLILSGYKYQAERDAYQYAKAHAQSLLEEEKKQMKQCAEFWNKGSIEQKYFDEYYQSLKTQQ